MKKLIINDSYDSIRIDTFIKSHIPHLSKTQLETLFNNNKIYKKQHNEKLIRLKKGDLLLMNEIIEIDISKNTYEKVLKPKLIDEVTILYEDNELLVVYKPEKVHSVPIHWDDDNTMLNHISAYLQIDICDLNWYIVNRLDFETSGILLSAKNQNSYNQLIEQRKKGTIKKYYTALSLFLSSQPKSDFREQLKIKSQKNFYELYSLFEGTPEKIELVREKIVFNEENYYINFIELFEGNRHQIRRILSQFQTPILGDSKYNGEPNQHLYLHAMFLEFIHPILKSKLFISCALPKYWYN